MLVHILCQQDGCESVFREGHQSAFQPPSTIQMGQMGTFGPHVVQVCVCVCVCVCACVRVCV